MFLGMERRKDERVLDKSFFTPESVAVVGASPEPGKLGNIVITNIIQYGYKGRVFPVNPAATEVKGLECYPGVNAIPGKVDMAVIVVPSRAVPGVMREIGEKKIKQAVIITAGFKETGLAGLKLENEVAAIARSNGIRFLGPNCFGFIDTSISLNATFASGMAKKGNISFLSQSGALAQAMLDWTQVSGVGFSKFVTLGNKADINESDLIEAWKDDPSTAVVIAYLEGVTDGSRFRKAAIELTRIKPFILIKAGRTAAGSRAASSHTGTLAGFDAAYSAIFKQTGILRAESVEELIDFAAAFADQPIIKGERIAIVTNAGGPGIMASDASEQAGLRLAQFTKETIDKLRSSLPPTANIYNPVDVVGDAGADRYQVALDAVLKDPNVDGALVLLTPQDSTEITKTAEVITGAAASNGKSILTSFMGGPAVTDGIRLLTENSIPNYPFPERAIESFKAMVRYRNWLEKKPEPIKKFVVDREKARAVLDRARKEKRRALSDIEASRIIGAYGIPLPASKLARNADEAAVFAAEIGFPVVMKIASLDILHKSDIGGVKVNITTPEAARNAYIEIVDNATRLMPEAQITGVDVQALIKGREVILGMNSDATFGPLLLFGLGGIYVEVLKDVTFRVAPITTSDANDMIREIRSYPLLTGVRGERPADIPAVVDALLRLSQLVTDLKGITELDINPLMVREAGKGAVAIDCRMGISIE
jgi:acetyl coenzyme A synthetase (ADP forming)-like protein